MNLFRLQRQDYHRTELPNGLRIVSAPRHESESLTIGIWIGVGGRYESVRLNGISHFLEHLLFKGTTNHSSRHIKETVEGGGGVFNAFTDEEFTCVWAKVQPKELAQTVELLTDMVLHPLLDAKEMEKERGVILEEIRMYRDLPMQSVHDLLNRLLWPNHPLGMILSGTEASVRRIHRKDAVSFQRRFYTPRNIVIAACGRLSHRALVEALERWWSAVPSGRAALCRAVHGHQHSPRFHIETKETEQTHVSLGFHAFPRNHPDVQALNLLNVIIGGNMSSRLFQELREDRGLAYEISSYVKRYQDTGVFSVSAGVEHRHLTRSLQVILKQLKRIAREQVTPKELEQAMEYFAGQILFALEDTVEHMCWLGECEMLLRRIEPVEKILTQMARVRRSDLTRVARKVLVLKQLNLAVISPVKSDVHRAIERLVVA